MFFTTMIDLYAIPDDFPGLEEARKLHHLPYERVQFLERAFAEDIDDPRFVPYIQLHEYEAYLFSDPQWFGYFYAHSEIEIAALKSIAAGYTSPELINDGPTSAPSKRIIANFPDYAGAKVAIGSQVAALIGLDAIQVKCPHFADWLSRLEQLSASL